MKDVFLGFVVAIAFLVLPARAETPPRAQADARDSVYLFSYFTVDGQDGLHLAVSHDGLSWRALNDGKSFLKPTFPGKTQFHREENMIRDPCVILGPDGLFHCVWTSSWWDREFGYAQSRDLIHWSKPRAIPVMENDPTALNCWTPAVVYDPVQRHFVVFWATTVPGRDPVVASPKGEKDLNHRMYCKTTTDFTTFGPTKIFFDPSFSVINAHVLREKRGDWYYMFVKDERPMPAQKNIRVTKSKKIAGPYDTKVSAPITGKYWAEGPTALQIGDAVIVYFEKYIGRQMGAVRSVDMVHWEDISDQVSFPKGTRMGTAFPVSRKIFEKLDALAPVADRSPVTSP